MSFTVTRGWFSSINQVLVRGMLREITVKFSTRKPRHKKILVITLWPKLLNFCHNGRNGDDWKQFSSQINIVQFSDEAVKNDNEFRLISNSGGDISPGERGLLLYKGGTVCHDDLLHQQNNYSGNAICREMGYKRVLHWTFGYLYDHDYQRSFNITLSYVFCTNEDWRSCTYSTSPQPRDCGHSDDVFLTCSGEYLL